MQVYHLTVASICFELLASVSHTSHNNTNYLLLCSCPDNVLSALVNSKKKEKKASCCLLLVAFELSFDW